MVRYFHFSNTAPTTGIAPRANDIERAREGETHPPTAGDHGATRPGVRTRNVVRVAPVECVDDE
jgi:hypothetical protein